jgi:hypothetical protein
VKAETEFRRYHVRAYGQSPPRYQPRVQEELHECEFIIPFQGQCRTLTFNKPILVEVMVWGERVLKMKTYCSFEREWIEQANR